MPEKPLQIKTQIPVIGQSDSIENRIIQVLGPTFQQIMMTLNDFEGRLSKLEESTKSINVYINPSEVVHKLFEVKSDSTDKDTIKTGD